MKLNRILVVVLVLYCALTTVRSILLQRRLTRLETFVVQDHKQTDQKLNAALSMASDAIHIAADKHITPPMSGHAPRRAK